MPGVRAAQEPQRRDDAGRHGAAGDDDVRRHHRAGGDRARPHGRGPLGAGRAPGRRGAAHRAEPDRARDLRATARCSSPLQGFTAAILILAANTAFNGFPVLVVAARARRLPAAPARQPRRPAGLLQRDRAARRGRGAADRRLQRRGDPPDPALHPRRLPVVHAQPGRAWSATGPTSLRDGARARRARRASGASRRSTRRARVATGRRLRDRAGDQVRRRARGSSSSRRRSCSPR